MPLDLRDAETPLTVWKLRRALSTGGTCIAALQTGAVASVLPDFVATPQCGIADQVELTSIGGAQLEPLNTRCQTALRLAAWHRFGVVPAAETHFGQGVAEIAHISSYSCRQIRTPKGQSTRLSTHATAEAVDVSGFLLENGMRVTLTDGWDNPGQGADFLREIHKSACKWFGLTLGPNYNNLHANHFHLQHSGSGWCR